MYLNHLKTKDNQYQIDNIFHQIKDQTQIQGLKFSSLNRISNKETILKATIILEIKHLIKALRIQERVLLGQVQQPQL